MSLDDNAIEAMQAVLDYIIPGAEVYSTKNELAETTELGLTVGILVSTTMSDEHVEDYSDRAWGNVLAQLVEAVREAAFELSKAKTKLSRADLAKLGLDEDGRERE